MLIYNIVYCIFFEIIVGVNPAGMPLYFLLGQDDNDFIVDMVESERGALNFRAQTVYRHPLSLGQYMLVLLPLFLMRGKYISNLIISLLICILIVLSGSRGAVVPMILVLLISIIKISHLNLRKTIALIAIIIAAISIIPNKQWKKISKEVDPFVASLAFWDDQKQKDNDISGSSMEMRLDQFDAAIEEIDENPVFGRGYGYRDYYIFMHNDLHPDLLGFESVLLLYLVERGWLGLIFFFIMAFYIYKLFQEETSAKTIIFLVFLGYLLSIIMTGVRPLTLLFVCLSCSIVCGLASRDENLSDNALVQEVDEEQQMRKE